MPGEQIDQDENVAAPRRIPAWVWAGLGLLLGLLLAALFLAYGQPALLLEQMNLRYCG
jgi:hypothetical protein